MFIPFDPRISLLGLSSEEVFQKMKKLTFKGLDCSVAYNNTNRKQANTNERCLCHIHSMEF